MDLKKSHYIYYYLFLHLHEMCIFSIIFNKPLDTIKRYRTGTKKERQNEAKREEFMGKELFYS